MDDLTELLELAVDLAGRAGELLLDGLGRQRRSVATKSSGTDVVTEMDRASEALIVGGLRRARPYDAIVAEEGSDQAGTSGVRWVVDPLDGTTNYLYGLPGFAVSIAAERDGHALVGAVNDPSHGEVFTAARGRGARCNSEPISVSGHDDLATALVATGFPYRAEHRVQQAALLQGVVGAVRDVRRLGAAAIDLCWVGCGRVDAFYEAGLQPWDLAAGVLVAEEAGGLTSDLEGGRPSPTYVVAASPDVAGPLLQLLRAAGARPLGTNG